MTETDTDPGGPPPRFVAYNDAKIHYRKVIAVVVVATILMLLPFIVNDVSGEAHEMVSVLVVVILLWGALVFRRARDQREQVVVDGNGIYVRDWHVGLVPWDNIDFIAHSSSVRRSLMSSISRSRRGPYLLFKFVQAPKPYSELSPPWSFFQRLWAEMELQEPVIQQMGLNKTAVEMLAIMQEHIAYWQSQQPDSSHSITTA